MADVRHLQKSKISHISGTVLLIFAKFYHDDAHWASEPDRKLKFPTIGNPRWWTAAILKIENRPYLRNGSADLHKICHSDAYWAYVPDRKSKFPTFKNPRWWTAAILKIENRPYLWNG